MLQTVGRYRQYAPVIVRFAVSLVFLWFGLNQIFDTASWVGWLPAWVISLPISPEMFVRANGIIEVVLASFLVAGKFTRLSSLILSVHLLGIAFSLGYNDVAVRDFGLSMATFSVFLNGPDSWCIDKKNKA